MIHEDAYLPYALNYSKPGIVVIFNNKVFRDDILQKRYGSVHDVRRLYDVFTNLKYEIKLHEDLDATQIRNAIREYTQRDYSNDDSFICFIMSHGSNGQIKSSDNESIFITEFIDPLKLNQSLKDKPKLFFIEACRGNKYVPTISTISNGEQLYHDAVFELELERQLEVKVSPSIPIEADFLLCNSTVEGYNSSNKISSGSFYIQILCNVISKYPGEEINKILTIVNDQVAQTKIMMSTYENRLRKPLYLTRSPVMNRNDFNKLH